MTTNAEARAWARIESPLGDLIAQSEGPCLAGLDFAGAGDSIRAQGRNDPRDPVLAQVAAELREYFARERRTFDVPLGPRGTPFQRRVWDALLTIPYGATESYAYVARRIGQPAAVRAVGLANGRNPIAILIPCHRVIGADGSLTGYAGGLAIKRALLALEGANVAAAAQSSLALS